MDLRASRSAASSSKRPRWYRASCRIRAFKVRRLARGFDPMERCRGRSDGCVPQQPMPYCWQPRGDASQRNSAHIIQMEILRDAAHRPTQLDPMEVSHRFRQCGMRDAQCHRGSVMRDFCRVKFESHLQTSRLNDSPPCLRPRRAGNRFVNRGSTSYCFRNTSACVTLNCNCNWPRRQLYARACTISCCG